MKKPVKAIGKVFAVTLALVLIVSSLTTAFAAQGVSGSRGSDPKGIVWKRNFSFTYNDAQGTTHTFTVDNGLPMKVHYFSMQNEALDFANDAQRAYCIEPERYSELESHGNTYYYNGTTSSVGMNAYDRQLSAAQKKMLNIVLANGYGTMTPATTAYCAYWYATQLLVYETVMGIRNASTFEFNASNYTGFVPTQYLATESTSETTPKYIQSAYNDVVNKVKLTLQNPPGTTSSASTAPAYTMVFSEKDNQYVYYLNFNDIITTKYGTENGKNYSPMNITRNDISIQSATQVNYAIDKTNQRIVFASYSPISASNPAVITIRNPRVRGINNILQNNSAGKYGKYGLMTMQCNDESYNQAFAIGAAQLPDSYSYFKLKSDSKMSLILKKVSANPDLTDGNSCYSLAGAKYGIYWTKEDADNNTNLKGIIVTDENGEGVYSNSQGTSVPVREYWGREIEPSPGYMLDTTTYRFTDTGQSDENGASVFSITSEEIPESDPVNIFLWKYNILTGQSEPRTDLGGAIFEVKFYDGYFNSEEEVSSLTALKTWYFTTDQSGRIGYRESYLYTGSEYPSDPLYTDHVGFPNLPSGTLAVREVKAPDGYLINDKVEVMPIDAFTNFDYDNNPENPILFEETPKGGLTIIKKSDDGQIANIYFEVKKSGGEVIGVYSTNESGVISLESLDYADYIITELGILKGTDGSSNPIYEIPERYTPEENPKTVTVDASSSDGIVVEFVNHVPMGKITINKTSDDGVVKGIFFKITGSNGYSKTVSTSSSGTVTVKNLPVYDTDDNLVTYTVSEIGVKVGTEYSFPVRYIHANDQTVIFNEGSSSDIRTKTLSFHNETIKGNVQISKSSSDGDISGVAFRVESLSSSYSYNEVFTTDNSGKCYIENLPVYDTNDMKIQYRVSELGKWDNASQQYKLAGYYFEPEDQVFTLKDTVNGDNNVSSDYEYNGNTILVKFENHVKYFGITITKEADDGFIQDVWFNVSASDGSYNQNFSTNSSGEIEIANLLGVDANGNSIIYTVTELGTKQANGSFALSQRYYSVEPKAIDGVNYVGSVYHENLNYAEATFSNNNKLGDIQIVKTATDGKVSGVWFRLTDSEGNTHEDKCTDSSGKIDYKNLPVYNSSDVKIQYTVTELGEKQGDGTYKFPFKYEIVTPKTFTLKDDAASRVVMVSIENILKKGSATITKVDEDMNPLAGATIALYKSNGTLIGSQETGANGIVKFEELDQGDYYFVETKTPEGKNLLKGKVEFTISGESEETLHYNTTVKNTFNFELTPTGANGILYICIGGAAILAAGIVIIIYFKKKKK